MKGQPAPMTERKKELIVASRTEGQQEAAILAEALNRHPDPVVLAMKDIVEWVRSSIQGRMYDTDLEIRKAMREVGAFWYEDRFLIGGRVQLAAMNDKMFNVLKSNHKIRMTKNVIGLVKSDDDPEEVGLRKMALNEEMRKAAKKPNDITNSSM
jgi:hypothetical protein